MTSQTGQKMSRKDIEDAVVREITNDQQTKKFLDEVGHDAVIEREEVGGQEELTAQLREVLECIGQDIQKVGTAIPGGMDYVGSAAVHIYLAPATGTVGYYSQLALGKCPEALAGPAVSDLRNAMLANYGHRRQSKRSGF